MEHAAQVLIVDDEKNLRTTLAEILREEGYNVDTATTGEEAIEKSVQTPYDAILLDVRMPGLGGVETFREIRRQHEKVRVIMMSAYDTDQLKRTALDEGAIAFLSKPLDIQSVVQLIGEVKGSAILVVESEEETAELIRRPLKERGYRVTVVSSAHDALELIEQIRFDVVFIDAALPVMNGLELYLAIKQVTPTAVAVMITGLEEEFVRLAQEAVRQTAYTFLQKPLVIDEVLELLERVTGQQVSGEVRKPNSGTTE